MGLIAPLAILAGALAALLLWPAAEPILGLSHRDFAAAATGAAVLAWLAAGGGLFSLLRAFVSAALWGVLIGGLWFGYVNRETLGGVLAEAVDSLTDSEPTVSAAGEVTFRRTLGGSFLVSAKVNDRPVKFVFDTGASTVVLTAEDALRVGLDASRLDFSADVTTANGSALAAPVRLARLAVGPIVVRNVRALVTRPGAMEESLLGISFLEQLDSYKVERGRLTLSAKRGPA